jgi:phage baseplate assembly protein W
MAFGAKKIFPLDTKPSVGVGVALPFNAPGVFRITYTTQESIKYNLINFFLTNQPERYLNPLFGGNLRKFVFEQIAENNLSSLKINIQSQLNNFFPNVIVEKLDIIPVPDYNTVEINLYYSIQNTGINDNIQITFT